MFLHSGAGLHGHEYSAQRQQSNLQPNSRPFPLLRSALRSHTETGDLRRTSNIETAARRRSLSAPRLSSDLPTRNRPVSESLSKKDLAVRFVEPDMELPASPAPTTPYSEDESAAASDLSDSTEVSARRKRRTRTPRQSTRFALAQPAPQHRTRQRMLVQIRPRLLLQLQQLNGQRPTPVLDVLPSSIVSGSLIVPILAKRFPRAFRARPDLGHHDLILMRSEDYNTPSGHVEGDPRRLADEDLLAVVSPLPHHGDDCVEIVMHNGSVWTSTPLANGSYEFTRVADDGTITTARWVKRAVRPPKSSPEHADQSPLPSPMLTEYKYTFSVMNPSTRRHPILGVLRASELEIFDTYSTMSASSGRYPPTKPFGGNIGGEHHGASKQENRATERVSEDCKQLMMATAIWIGLRQHGWPASASPKMRRALSHCHTSLNEYTEKGRRSTWFGGATHTSPTASPALDSPVSSRPAVAVNNIEGILDRPAEFAPPRRAMSTGAQFMRRRRMNSVMSEDGFDAEAKRLPEVVPVRAASVKDAGSVRDAISLKDNASVKDVRVLGHIDDGKTITCRTRLRRLTNKLFRRSDGSSLMA